MEHVEYILHSFFTQHDVLRYILTVEYGYSLFSLLYNNPLNNYTIILVA